MAKYKISEWSATSSDNTDIGNINIAEGCSPANINNAIRTVMSQVKDLQAGTSGDTIPITAGGTGSTTASAARTALSAAASGANSDITSLSGLTTPLSVAQGGTGVQVTRTISNVALTSNVVTITTSVAHGYLANDSVTVTATTQTTVNGTYTIISIPTSNTFTYAKTASNISSTVDTGSVVSSSNIKMANASGILSVVNGGTGAATLKANNLLVGNGTSSPSVIPAGTTNNVLISSSTSTVTAGSFAIGTEYTILTVGTTDFTLIGAASNTVGVVFTATGVGTGTGTVTTNTWVSGNSPLPAALSTASGSAPSYSARAFVKFSAAVAGSSNINGTYTHSGTTATVAATAHGLSVGHRIWLDFTSGTGTTDALYTVTSVTDANNFVATATASFTTAGNVTLQKQTIDYGKNVASVSRTSTTFTTFVINFTTPMETVNAPTLVTAQTSGYVNAAAGFLQDVNSVVVVVTASSAVVNVVTFE
jgi:hypothetical protein